MAVTDAYSILANVLEGQITAEFTDDPNLVVRHDKLHESMGSDGRTYVGIAPDEQRYRGIEGDITAIIRFYGPFNAVVDPQQAVDPRIITNKCERLVRRLRAVRVTGTKFLWYFDVIESRFPDDPTGNKSRFELVVVGRGNNSGLVETTG